MNIEEIVEVLIEYNKWRRDEAPYDNGVGLCPYSAHKIGEAIDAAVKFLKGE